MIILTFFFKLPHKKYFTFKRPPNYLAFQSFDYEHTGPSLFQKRTKLDIFIIITYILCHSCYHIIYYISQWSMYQSKILRFKIE